jgi:hypothetical protein
MPSIAEQTLFTPAGAVTGIGSLPFDSVGVAIQSVAENSPEIPFWPQLPQLNPEEGLICQGLDLLSELIGRRGTGYGFEVKAGRIDQALERLHSSDGRLTPRNAAGFGAFEEALAAGLFPSARAVKGQIEGPITLSTYLFYRGKPFLSEPAFFAALAYHVSQMVCWQIGRLRIAGLPVLMFVDEPALCLDGPPEFSVAEDRKLSALTETLKDVRSRGAIAGLHCCAARPFERMCCVKPDILSFDAHQGLELFFSNSDALDFVRRGGKVAYGLIPTQRRLEGWEPASTFSRWLKAAVLAGDPREMARNAMVTATCGLGLLNAEAVEESFRLAYGVGRLVRKLSGVEEEAATPTGRSSS